MRLVPCVEPRDIAQALQRSTVLLLAHVDVGAAVAIVVGFAAVDEGEDAIEDVDGAGAADDGRFDDPLGYSVVVAGSVVVVVVGYLVAVYALGELPRSCRWSSIDDQLGVNGDVAA